MRFDGRLAELSPETRATLLAAALADNPHAPEVWVFAYGSLLWKPEFAHAEARPARLQGYQRAFCIWSILSRGTPEQPGLALGLEAGIGACEGIAYRLDPATRDEGLKAVWDREMLTGVYEAHWAVAETERGPVSALAFVADRGHPQYAGAVDVARAAGIIARAAGDFGPCRDYLAKTVAALGRHGLRDDHLRALFERVDVERT